jgi:hypothetical protein
MLGVHNVTFMIYLFIFKSCLYKIGFQNNEMQKMIFDNLTHINMVNHVFVNISHTILMKIKDETIIWGSQNFHLHRIILQQNIWTQ